MAITGPQIRDARVLLGMGRSVLAQKVGCIIAFNCRRVEESEGEPTLSDDVAAVPRRTLERLGVGFTDDEVPGVRLPKGVL